MAELKQFLDENRWLTMSGFKTDRDGYMIRTAGLGHDPTNTEWLHFLDSLDALKLDLLGGHYQSATSGARVEIFPDANTGIQVIDDAAADVFKCLVGGTDIGDVIIGDYGSAQGAKYDKSAGTLDVKAILTANAGSSISTGYLNGDIPQANLDVADRRWVQTCVFSVIDSNDIAWTSGTFTSADGTAYSIGSGNTTTMPTKTYIYLDIAVSTTAYQVTTTATTAVGVGKVMVAVADANTGEATFLVLQGQGGLNIDAASIVAGSITANEISTSIITAGKVTADYLTADNIQAGTLTGRTVQTAATGQRAVVSGADNNITITNTDGDAVITIDDFMDGANRPGIAIGNTIGGFLILQKALFGAGATRITQLLDGYIDILNDVTDAANPLRVRRSANGAGTTILALHSAGVTTPHLFAGYVDTAEKFGVDSSGNITCAGTVDGRDVATDGTKLDGIAAGAQPGTVTGVTGTAPIASSGGTAPAISIGAASGAAAGSMSSAHYTKLDGIEAAADVTDATNVAAAGAVMDGDFSTNGFMKRTAAGTYGIDADGLDATFTVLDQASTSYTLVFTNGLLTARAET